MLRPFLIMGAGRQSVEEFSFFRIVKEIDYLGFEIGGERLWPNIRGLSVDYVDVKV